jgi:hypothetical protein
MVMCEVVFFCSAGKSVSSKSDMIHTDRSRAEKLWLVWGVMGDVMLCDRESDIHPCQKFYATIHSEKITYLTIVLFCKR